MEKLMKSIYVVLTSMLMLSAIIVTIVSIYRLEWVSIVWILVAVIAIYLFKGSILEYKKND
jgi:hypothetical protein